VNSCIKIAIDVLDTSVYTFLILLKYNNVNYNYSKILVQVVLPIGLHGRNLFSINYSADILD